MGVHGLWKLIEPTGKTIKHETLENKVLAIDISIWLHQMVKGFQDTRGALVPNAHLLGLFHRVCKLLFYKIKPVFIFDGGVPHLKLHTLNSRKLKKSQAQQTSDQIREKILKNLIKHKALQNALGVSRADLALPSTSRKDPDDMFILPPIQKAIDNEENDDDSSSEEESFKKKRGFHTLDVHSIDVKSEAFLSLPPTIRHEILSELKETRKRNSWASIGQMPEKGEDFSGYQMKRLLKRRAVQESLEEAEKEMKGRNLSLEELDSLLNNKDISKYTDLEQRISYDNITRYLFIKGSSKEENSSPPKRLKLEENNLWKNELKIEKSGKVVDKIFQIWEQNDLFEYESEEESILENNESPLKTKLEKDSLQLAFAYMVENSGFTQSEIYAILNNKTLPEQVQSLSDKNDFLEYLKNNKIISEESINSEVNNDENNILINKNDEIDQAELLSIIKNEHEQNINKINIEKCETSDLENNFQSKEKNEFIKVTNKENSKFTNKSLNENIIPMNEEETTKRNSKIIFQNEENKNLVETDSEESDDFIDVSDEHNDDDDEKSKKSSLQIIINTVSPPNDDIFKDIFDTQETPKSNSSENTENIIIKSENREISINEKDNSDNKFKKFQEPSETEFLAKENKSIPLKPIPKPTLTEHDSIEKEHNILIISNNESIPLKPIPKPTLGELDSIEKEHSTLISERNRQERLAANISQQLSLDAQELLQLFGIPYIIAPMEAEAQCAFLDAAKLTDGTITEDSDIWLFGGRRVYKHFFNPNKTCVEYQLNDITNSFNLTRERMILLALLVGSDYTVGLTGIGPVTALEILAAFPPKGSNATGLVDGLRDFRDWNIQGQPPGPKRTHLKSKLKNLEIKEGFPSTTVVEAYLEPKIDDSKEKFSWTKPNLEKLREFSREKFGWTPSRADSILIPVLNRLESKTIQLRIDSFFEKMSKTLPASIQLSKRVQKAVKNLNSENKTEESSFNVNTKNRKPQTKVPTKKRKNNSKKLIKNDIDVVNQASSSKEEFIHQREMDKQQLMKNKMKAIETFRKSKYGLDKTKADKKLIRKIKNTADLSDSDSN